MRGAIMDRTFLTVGVVVIGTMLAVPSAARGAEPDAEAKAAPPPRPQFKLPRDEEDWSSFDPATGDDWLDPIKHVSLTDDGSVWASFGGELRLRVENWQNFGFNGNNDDTFALGRALLHADLHVGEHVRFFVQGISALATDRDLPGGQRTLDVNELDLQSAFADIIFPTEGGPTFTLRVGRQEFLFGKQRLVSPLPWANDMRSWDAARLIVELDRWRVDAFFSRYINSQKYEFDDWEPGSDFYGVYAAGKVGASARPFDLDLYFLGLNRSSATFNGTTGEEDRFSIGARFGGKIGDTGLDFDVEGTYQFGDVGSADVSAFSIAALLGYTFGESSMTPRVHLGFDYASGDDSPGDGDVNTFNQLFPLGHAYFGYMDFVGRQNVIDVSGGFSIKPLPKLTLKLEGHLFWRADTSDAMYNAGGGVVRPGGGSDESEIGQEIDLTVIYALDRHLTLEAGYSHFFSGAFIEDTGPDDDMDWVYAMATYRF